MMPKVQSVADVARRAFPDLSRARARVEADLHRLTAERIEPLGIPDLSTAHPPRTGQRERVPPPAGELAEWLRVGAEGIDKLARGAPLGPREEIGLEAIVHLYGRPALLIQNDDFGTPPPEWQHLERMRNQIQQVIRSVGRIELENHHTYPWAGTGFLAGPGVVMTNRHVAEVFSAAGDGGWVFLPGVTARIDYKEEFQSAERREFAVTSVLGIHPTYDLAFLRVEPTGTEGQVAPASLQVAASAPTVTENVVVYVVGYPAMDGRRNDREEMLRIFASVFNVKRLQPGLTTGLKDTAAGPVLGHDCSTLGGNSGSCVVDLATGKVIGLHFGGRYLQGNVAVPLWLLVEDPLLATSQVNFG